MMVETDCLEAVKMEAGNEECFVAEGFIVDKIRSLLRMSCFQSLSHVPRTANRAAHAVASFVARLNGCFWWLGVGSSSVTKVLFREESGEVMSTTGHSHIL